VTLTVNATDDKGVTKVAFFYQQYETYHSTGTRLLLGTDTDGSDGWSYVWNNGINLGQYYQHQYDCHS
jgi:hypothetical protein